MAAMRPRSRQEDPIPLTIDEHRELGREMKATAQRLRALCELVVSVYGPANRASFSFLKALEANPKKLPGRPADPVKAPKR